MSTLDPRRLPGDRLSTTDQDGARVWIIPDQVKGYWKKRKTILHVILLLIFVLTPWLRLNDSPLLLFDIFNRQFVVFGRVFGAHDGPILFFIAALVAFTLIIATALWGRVWCGWACPQTVFIEQVFRRIETWVIGNRNQQIACHREAWKPKNFFKISVKWLLFAFVSAFLAHTFMAYFVSWERLLQMMQAPPHESWTVFVFVFVLTAILLFDFGWFREQFCIIMCPYGRFQSVLMDSSSLTVAYDYNRGEPRMAKAKSQDPGQGDCIDCYRCVAVCPTGIDIRQGSQLECIACTACIDACDEIMTKINRPKGLIRYASELELTKPEVKKKFQPRLALYGVIFALLSFGLSYLIYNHQSLYVSVLRQSQRPYVVNGGRLLNNFRVHIKNPNTSPLYYRAHFVTDGEVKVSPSILEGELQANQSMRRPFFVELENYTAAQELPTVRVEVSYAPQAKDLPARPTPSLGGSEGSKAKAAKTNSQSFHMIGPRP